MKDDLKMVQALRRVLEASTGGRGTSKSAIEELAGVTREGKEVARSLLLGLGLRWAMVPLEKAKAGEVRMLSSLLGEVGRSSAESLGRGAGELSATLEKWISLSESKKLETRVQEYRGLLASGILGAVSSMVASLGPMMGSLNFSAQLTPPDPTAIRVAAAIMSANGAAMLGLYLSGRRFVLNVVGCILAFLFVSALVSPLLGVQTSTLWGR